MDLVSASRTLAHDEPPTATSPVRVDTVPAAKTVCPATADASDWRDDAYISCRVDELLAAAGPQPATAPRPVDAQAYAAGRHLSATNPAQYPRHHGFKKRIPYSAKRSISGASIGKPDLEASMYGKSAAPQRRPLPEKGPVLPDRTESFR